MLYPASIFESVIKLVEGKIIRTKQLWDHFIKSFCFGAWLNKPCINKGRNQVKNIKAEISSSLHQINIFFNRQLIVNVFHRKISNEFFRRIIRDQLRFLCSFNSLCFLIQLINFFFVERDRILDAFSLKFVNIADRFISFVSSMSTLRIVKT